MTTDKQLKANQANSKRSTGPKTAAGKGKASRNATRHGILSEVAIIPGLESQEEWDRHLAETVADLKPQGRVANWLAQRVASYQWRLRRVARYASETTVAGLESVEREFARKEFGWESIYGLEELPLAKAEKIVKKLRASSELLQKLPELPEEQAIADCSQLVAEAFELTGFTPEELRSHVDKFAEWTAGLARELLQRIAEYRKIDLVDLLERMTAKKAGKLKAAQKDYEDLAQRVEQCRRQRIIPDGPVLEKIARYEAHLERGLYKALYEFREFQRQSAGQRTPAPRKN